MGEVAVRPAEPVPGPGFPDQVRLRRAPGPAGRDRPGPHRTTSGTRTCTRTRTTARTSTCPTASASWRPTTRSPTPATSTPPCCPCATTPSAASWTPWTSTGCGTTPCSSSTPTTGSCSVRRGGGARPSKSGTTSWSISPCSCGTPGCPRPPDSAGGRSSRPSTSPRRSWTSSGSSRRRTHSACRCRSPTTHPCARPLCSASTADTSTSPTAGTSTCAPLSAPTTPRSKSTP